MLKLPSFNKNAKRNPGDENAALDNKKNNKKSDIFDNNFSFKDCLIPPLDNLEPSVRQRFLDAVSENDRAVSLRKLLSLTGTQKLHAIKISRNSSCLLNAVSVAISGTNDYHNTLRDLIWRNIMKNNKNFKASWLRQQRKNLQANNNQGKSLDIEWNEVVHSIRNLQSSPLDTFNGFMNCFLIYVLANILHRPIIVLTDNLTMPTDRNDKDENDCGGLYLPSQQPSHRCCETPIILSFKNYHFCPMLSEARLQNGEEKSQQLFPLVASDFTLLPVWFTKDAVDNKTMKSIKSYLLVTEVDVMRSDRSVIKVPCAQLNLKALEPISNPFYERLQCLKEKITQSGMDRDTQYDLYPVLEKTEEKNQQFDETEMRTEIEMLPYEEDHPLTPTAPLLSIQPLTPTAPFPSLEIDPNVQINSMMDVRCRNRCDYKCSKNTFPFCHECNPEQTHGNQETEEINNTVLFPSARTETRTKKETSHHNSEHALFENSPKVIIPNAGLFSYTLEPSVSENKHSQNTENCISGISNMNYGEKNSEQKVLDPDHSVNQTGTVRCNGVSAEREHSGRNIYSQETSKHESESKEESEIIATNGISVTPVFEIHDSESDDQNRKYTELNSEFISQVTQSLASKNREVEEYFNQEQKEDLVSSSHNSEHSKMSSAQELEPHSGKEPHNSNVKNPGDCLQAGMSLSGTAIHQASEDVPTKQSSHTNSWDSQIDKRGSYTPLSSKSSSDSKKCEGKQKNQISSYSEGHIACEFKNDNNTPQETNHSVNTQKTSAEIYIPKTTLPVFHTLPEINTNNNKLSVTRNTPFSPPDKLSQLNHPHDQTYQQNQLVPQGSVNYLCSLNDLQEKAVIVTNVTRYNSPVTENQMSVGSPLLFNQQINHIIMEDFQNKIQNLRTVTTKCRTPFCQNSIFKEGYCGDCYKPIRRQRILEEEARQGMDVPD